MSDHDIGDVVTLWGVFRDAEGTQTAPTTVALHVKSPDGVTVLVTHADAEASDEARAEAATGQTLSGVTGVYKASVACDQAGTWRYKWTGTGMVAEMEQAAFDVRRDRVGVPVP